MATTKSAKIEAEIEKVKAKIAEQQTKLKELEQRKIEAENSEIVDMVRGMSVSLTELPLLLEKSDVVFTCLNKNVLLLQKAVGSMTTSVRLFSSCWLPT